MFRNAISYRGMLLLAAAVILATPALGSAHGGRHFGGARIAGFRSGAVHYSHVGSSHYGGLGGFRNRTYSGYFHYYGGYPYGAWGAAYGLDYGNGYADPTTTDGDWYASPVPPPIHYAASAGNANAVTDTLAHVTVSVPADAQVWFNGTKMKTTGTVRQYESPPLTPGSRYTYQVQARWIEDGHEMTETRLVNVIAGEYVTVTFPTAVAATTPD